MWELIEHQRYRAGGTPVDVAQYHNHGTPIATKPAPGRAPGQSAIGFPVDGSVVSLARIAAQWSPLIALRIEAMVYVDPMAARTQTLIDGFGAFRFGIMEGALEGGFEGPSGSNYIRSDSTYAPDGTYHPVPANRWVSVGFEHDGYARMRLTLDGALVAQAAVTTGIPPVQGTVTLGNDAARLRRWHGAIDELQVWRLYPKAIDQEFLCRPWSRHAAQCWEGILRQARAWAGANPAECAAVLGVASAEVRTLVHGLLMLPPADQASVRALLAEQRRLWCKGQIDGADMQQVLARLFAALRAHGLDAPIDAGRSQLAALRARMELDPALDAACDPKLQAFLRHLAHALDAH